MPESAEPARPTLPETRQGLLAELDRRRIRAARGKGKARLSLQDIAGLTGVPRSSLATYLSGSSLMPSDVLIAVVTALGATPAQARMWEAAWEEATAEHLGPPPPAASDRPIPRQLPANVAAFTGREPYLAELDKLVESASGAAVVISAIAGTAGVGKTALQHRFECNFVRIWA